MRIYRTAFIMLALIVFLGSRWAATAAMYGSQTEDPAGRMNDQRPAAEAPFVKGGILVTEGGCNGRLLLVDRASKRVVWRSSGLRGAYCVASLPTGEIVVGEGKSVAIIDRNGKLASRLPASFQITTDVKPLHGGVLVSDGPAGTVSEMDLNGNIMWSISRLHWPSEAIRLENGNTLVADGTRQLKEFDSRGELLRTTKLERWAAAVHRLSDGNTLVGEAGAVELLDTTGSLIWSRAGFERATSVQELSNGEVLVCDPDGSRVVILDASGEIIWQRKGLVLPWRAVLLR